MVEQRLLISKICIMHIYERPMNNEILRYLARTAIPDDKTFWKINIPGVQ